MHVLYEGSFLYAKVCDVLSIGFLPGSVCSMVQPFGGWRTIKRPHLDTFLAYCINLFGEVVLFSDKQIIVRLL